MPLNIGALAGGFAEHAGELLLGFGVGTALAEALHPEAVELAQAAWQQHPVLAIEPDAAAAIVAEDVEARDWGAGEAQMWGVNGARFDALVQEALNAPGIGELLRLWRRGAIGDADFVHGLHKAKLEPRWDTPLESLKDDRLDPSAIAVMVQRGIMPNDGLLPVGPPEAVGNVPPMPMIGLDPVHEAAASGINRERLAGLARIVGLPPAPGELLQLINRGTITEADFYRGVAEGNTRNEWAPALLELRHRLNGPATHAELWLKGWLTEAEAVAKAARVGYSRDELTDLYHARGRPPTPTQGYTAWARGVDDDHGNTFGVESFRRLIAESNVRTEWADTLWALRHNYPSLFQLRRAVTDGGISRERALTILQYQRYEDRDAVPLVDSWLHGTGTAAKAETRAELRTEYEGGYISEAELRAALAQLGYSGANLELEVHLGDATRAKAERDTIVRLIRDEYVYHEIDDAQATAELGRVQVLGDGAARLIALWSVERSLIRRRLTDAQLVKAFKKGLLTKAVALERLTDLGLSADDANTRLLEG